MKSDHKPSLRKMTSGLFYMKFDPELNTKVQDNSPQVSNGHLNALKQPTV
jgi:hypothetical protein